MNRLELLTPSNHAYRQTVSLEGLWYYACSEDAKGWERGLPRQHVVPVPANLVSLPWEAAFRFQAGPVWLQRDLFIRKEWMGQELHLRFEGVSHRFQIFINGMEVGRMREGRTPCLIDITKQVRYGEHNTLVIKIHREMTHTTMPMGQTGLLSDGTRLSIPQGPGPMTLGIHRPVTLCIFPSYRILDYQVQVVEITSDYAVIDYRVMVQGNCLVTATLRNAEGKVVATGVGGTGSLTIENPKLWTLGEGYLYRVDFEASRLGKACDMYAASVALRQVTTKDGVLFLNDIPQSLRLYPLAEEWLQQETHPLQRAYQLVVGLRGLGYDGIVAPPGVVDEHLRHMMDVQGMILWEQIPLAPLAHPSSSSFASLHTQQRMLHDMPTAELFGSSLGWILCPPPTADISDDAYVTTLLEEMEALQQRGALVAGWYTVGHPAWPSRLLHALDALFVHPRRHANSPLDPHTYGELRQRIDEFAEAHPHLLLFVGAVSPPRTQEASTFWQLQIEERALDKALAGARVTGRIRIGGGDRLSDR